MEYWNGRIDEEEGENGLRWHQKVQTYDGSQAVALIGFACDAGVARNKGRTGAAQGPDALRQSLSGLPVFGSVPADAGNIVCHGDDLENARQRYTQSLLHMMVHGTFPIGIGGGHEIAYASGRALYQAYPQKTVGIINIDPHLDLRIDSRPGSGTPFRELADDCAQSGRPFHYLCLGVSKFANTQSLFNRADKLNVRMIYDTELLTQPWETTARRIDDFCAQADVIYLTIDSDCIAGNPAVSAPAALGLPLHLIETAVRQIFSSQKVRIADVAEYNPRYDRDAQGARMVSRLIATITEEVGKTFS
ncbi:formimidoylglutamase [Neisseria animalis]|uniref:Formimidoylglutamase n=1 Tax=Neisseria animalis TaxID=492 RepID=A0A5P3MU20_NEIAN|nr:formimidoylglutamase [Neisseria animalis]QEY24555.1 formimidoylglutamase [Neisseria animalis]ROW33029.1 formimidoylglutamase [Neisseria animalis]VEE07351.1 Formimidoylglutamase [Neisseria animalis]